jgi:NDP-sugar pyrophosphorylase family protein
MSSASRRAVILAGGKGMRLRPYTVVLPKPLMPIGEYPILEVIVRQLAAAGFDRLTFAVNHQAEIIKAYFGDGGRWNTRIDYSLEARPLGTMGPLRLIPDLPENTLVMNGDILTDLNFAAFHDDHIQAGAAFTISSMRRQMVVDYGVLETDGGPTLTGFKEKPSIEYQVSMGVYMVGQRAIGYIPEGKPYGFDNLMLDMLAANDAATVRPFEGYWLDIGRPDDYMRAIDEFDAMRKKFLCD